jgi:hypothetical protein
MSHYNGTIAFTKYKQWQGSKKTIYQQVPPVLLKKGRYFLKYSAQ